MAAGERSAEAAAIDPAGLLLLAVILDGLTLSDGIGGYGDPDDPLLPVTELSRLLEADIDVYPAEQRIIGRIGEARRSLLVDLRSGVARAAGQEIALGMEDAAVTATDIYLRASALSRLLPLDIEVRADELTVRLKARERFPVQARLQRLAGRPDPGAFTRMEDEALTVAHPYALFSPPAVDVVLDAGLKSRDPDRSFRYDVRLAGDVGYANFQGFLASDEEGRPSNVRVLLQRRSIEGGMFGPLRARELNLGDTFTPGLALGPRSLAGRGVSMSTLPLDHSNIFNRVDLRGELPPGYDAELYVNDVLRGSAGTAVNGRYEFLDVPLSPGLNVLRIVTYGPRGERAEEVQVINVGAGLLRPGEATFVLGAVDQDQPLIRTRSLQSSVLGQPGVYASGGLRAVAAVNYGLAERLTLALGGARVPQIGGTNTDYLTLGARTSLFGLATQFDLAWDDEGGQAGSLGVAGEFHGVSGVLRHAEYRNGFRDENNIGATINQRLERRTELTFDSNLELRGRILPVSVRAIRDEYQDGSYDLLGGARASTSVGRLLWSAGLEHRRQAFRSTKTFDTLSGYVAASTYRGYRWQIRSTLDYDILPDFRARLLSVTVDRLLSDRWSLRFAIGQPFDDTSAWNVVLSSINQTRYGDFAITGEYENRERDWRLSAQWSFGLGYNPARDGYELTRIGAAAGGSAVFDAFVDTNGDGVRQAGEAPAPDVLVSNGATRSATGADGRLYVTGLGAGPSTRLDVSLERLENTSVKTPPSRVELRPRPGSVSRVAYPMQPTGEVMVKVELLRDDGKAVGLSSVRLQLAPKSGEVFEAMTEFDGSAIFEAVPVGAYRLQLEPRQAEKLRMRLLSSPTVVITGDGGLTPDVVVQVRFDPPGVNAAATGGG